MSIILYDRILTLKKLCFCIIQGLVSCNKDICAYAEHLVVYC